LLASLRQTLFMHWLDSQLKTLYQLAEAYEQCRVNNSDDYVEEIRQSRTAFIDKVQSLVDSVVKQPNISGCVAGHEGLILAKAGLVSDSDALGAMIQESMSIAQRSKELLDLGSIQQIVIVGENNKVAMISVGQLTLSILSPKNTNLAKSLSNKPH